MNGINSRMTMQFPTSEKEDHLKIYDTTWNLPFIIINLSFNNTEYAKKQFHSFENLLKFTITKIVVKHPTNAI